MAALGPPVSLVVALLPVGSLAAEARAAPRPPPFPPDADLRDLPRLAPRGLARPPFPVSRPACDAAGGSVSAMMSTQFPKARAKPAGYLTAFVAMLGRPSK